MPDAPTPIGNNAQITGKILMQLANTCYPPEQQQVADDLLRAMILVRMTGPTGYLTASEVEWRSEFDDDTDEDGDDLGTESPAARQGAGLVKTQELISDTVSRIFDDDVIKTRVRELLPAVDDDAYSALETFVWIVLTNIEYFGSYENITAPTFDAIDSDHFVRSYLRWYYTWLDEQSES